MSYIKLLPNTKKNFPCLMECMMDGVFIETEVGVRTEKKDFKIVHSPVRGLANYYHAYGYSLNDVIGVGDWYLNLEDNFIAKSTFGKHRTQVKGVEVKIIASTDTTLILSLIIKQK